MKYSNVNTVVFPFIKQIITMTTSCDIRKYGFVLIYLVLAIRIGYAFYSIRNFVFAFDELL